ncbi:chemotaxis protein [Thiolapillus sp.]|uniref:chemotaxis protein n=1 Tax=Thiolapillus sp. TaxID=2017437 RepID=UPI003AF50646
MLKMLIAFAVIFLLMLVWILVQQAARSYAARNPELGPAKEEGLGCGKNCGCKGGSCRNSDVASQGDDWHGRSM